MRRRCALDTSESEQSREVAVILAKGYLRLLQKRRITDIAEPAFATATEFRAQGLELSEKTVLSVSPGVNGPESSQFSRSTT